LNNTIKGLTPDEVRDTVTPIDTNEPLSRFVRHRIVTGNTTRGAPTRRSAIDRRYRRPIALWSRQDQFHSHEL